MPTLNDIRDKVRVLIQEKGWPLNTERALWRICIEAGEASDIYLKTGLKGYVSKKTHKPLTDEEAFYTPASEKVLAKDAFLEELIDVVFFIVNSTHVECADADLDKVFNDKLAYNFTRPKLYGVSDKIKAEAAQSHLAENTKKMDAKRLRRYPKLSGRELKSIAFGEDKMSPWGENNGA
jgi:hypothetical protein